MSFSGSGMTNLPSLGAQPLQTKWDEPEDPQYLLPLPEPKDADFATVKGCTVFASHLGYRLKANSKETLGLALKHWIICQNLWFIRSLIIMITGF